MPTVFSAISESAQSFWSDLSLLDFDISTKAIADGKGKKKNPTIPPSVFVHSFFFLAFPSFPSPPPHPEPLRRPHGRETKSLSSCFGLFFITTFVCFLTPESRLKLLHSPSFTIARDTVPLVSADVPKVLCSPLSITSNFGKYKAWTFSRKMFLSWKSGFFCPKSNLFELEMLFETSQVWWNS